jgi:predicted unusual protein kinase regulating ubiquinone biosynthesis (AarF/ABC1/UbiB family)/ribosomal protein L7/L12
MSKDDVRAEIAARIASATAPLSTSSLGRRAGWVAGLARAGAKSLGRSVRRTVGGGAGDLDPEAEVAASFGQLKGPMMKVGQMLGYVDVGLPDALRSALSALHTSAQPLDAAWIHRILDEDLGDPGRALGRAMDPRALSAASVGQVHRATLPDGTNVVVKALLPGLATIIERDFGPLMFASRISAPLHAVLGEIRARLLEECNYALEARRQTHFREILGGHPTLVIPEVHLALSSARVLTTSFAEGLHIDRYLASAPSQEARNRVGEALFDFYFAPLFIHGVYNGDPHPGNYVFLADGRVVVVDFGCTRAFEPGFVFHLASLTHAVMEDDLGRMHSALVDLGLDRDVTYDRDATRHLLRALLGPIAHDEPLTFDLGAEITIRDALKSAWKSRRLAVSGELLFLLRTLLGLSSTLARLESRANWRRRLEDVVARSPVAAAMTGGAPEASLQFGGGPSFARRVGDGGSAAASSERTAARAVKPPPAARAVKPSPAPTPEPTWDVVLVGAGTSPIALIRTLREETGRELRDLESVVSSLPETLRQSIGRADAEGLRMRLEAAGARVEVRRTVDRTKISAV